MDPTRYADLFRSESREQLSAINRALLDLEARPGETQPVHALFRAVHSMKGLSASMGYASLTAFMHELEGLLERLRAGTQVVSPAVMDALYATADALEDGVDRAIAGTDDAPALADALAALRLLPGGAIGGPLGAAREAATAAAAAATREAAEELLDEGPGMLVRVRQRSGIVFPGVRAFMVIQKARALGELVAVSPPLAELQAAEISQAFAFRLVTPQAPSAIESAIRAVGDVEHVRVSAGRGRHRAPLRMTPTDEPVTAPTPTRYARVELSRLDRLVNLIGELAATRGQLQELTAGRGDAALDDAMARASLLIGELQAEVMASRLVPAWQLLDRFPRLVRDAARQLGKEIEFTVQGRELELDRFLLDELSEPVVHLLRNAVDHGIETPEVRETLGKPRAGRVTLSVTREGAAVLVRVRDDGRGIDRARVLARARALGLVAPDAASLDADALLHVIASPGFSMADTVSDLSGRGVGADAVLTRVRQLGGSMALETALGEGTTVTLRL